MSSRQNALNRPKAIRRSVLTKEDYLDSVMLADPLRRLDFCLETDGAVAVITTTVDRARDCRHKPALVHASAHGASRDWGLQLRSQFHRRPHLGPIRADRTGHGCRHDLRSFQPDGAGAARRLRLLRAWRGQ